MIKNSTVVKNKEEFEDMKLMMAEDCQINNKEVFFSEDVPEDFPCLVKIIEMEDVGLEFNFDENEDDPEDIFNSTAPFSSNFDSSIEEDDITQEAFGIFYDFWFLSKKEVQKLLES